MQFTACYRCQSSRLPRNRITCGIAQPKHWQFAEVKVWLVQTELKKLPNVKVGGVLPTPAGQDRIGACWGPWSQISLICTYKPHPNNYGLLQFSPRNLRTTETIWTDKETRSYLCLLKSVVSNRARKGYYWGVFEDVFRALKTHVTF